MLASSVHVACAVAGLLLHVGALPVMRREAVRSNGRDAHHASILKQTDNLDQRPLTNSHLIVPTATLGIKPAADVSWGDYKFYRTPSTDDCQEDDASTWEGQSLFEAWTGTDGDLSITEGAAVVNGVVDKTSKGLRIYKAACPNATTVKVGGVTEIPVGTTSVEIVFGIAKHCTGDCAPFMVSVLDGPTEALKYRWCWNREGTAGGSATSCDEVQHVPIHKWNRVYLNVSSFTDVANPNDPIKLALEVYTSGDFRLLPSLPDESGVGGRAMVIIDSLVAHPSNRPSADSSLLTSATTCRQSAQDVCGYDAWCMEKYRCYSGWCIDGSARCNSVRNCQDDSDEVGCEYPGGFHGEFFLNHARFIHNQNVDVNDLTHPDIRVLNQEIDYDADDFWQKLKARNNFAAKWTGNLTITSAGNYKFQFPTAGEAKLKIQGHGDVTSGTWITMPAGTFQVTLTYVHLSGPPSARLEYSGIDTQGMVQKVGANIVTATMTGSRCDTQALCANGESLFPKADQDKYMCQAVPCQVEADTSTCCTRKYMAVACGDYRTCALDMQGRPLCWGSWAGFNEQWKQHPGPYSDIATRGQYICGVFQETGMVDCWQPDDVSSPLIDYSAGGQFTYIGVGSQHTCALRESGFPACTGSNDENQQATPLSTEFLRLSAGSSFTCGITAGRTVQCWGDNSRGQSTPPTGAGHDAYTEVSAGEFHACGISNGAVSCWGWNNDAQATPPTGSDFTKVAAGGLHTCALKENGDAACWGANAEGQSDTIVSDAPYSTISAGMAHTCAIQANTQEIVCWGSNFEADPLGSLTWRGQSQPPPAGSWP